MTDGLDRAALEQVASWLVGARSVLFVTGAGISADSGLPTYRGIGGLYDDVETDDGIAIEDALSGETMRSRPELCWKYIAQIERACRGAKPNRGHEVIAAIGERIPRTVVLTQNVDGFHGAAGSENVIEIHGNVHELVCPRCSWTEHVDDYAGLEIPPLCPKCDAVARPAVVLFGEMLPVAAVLRLEEELTRGFDLVFSIGTTSVFPYIAAPVVQALRHGRPAVEVNPGNSQVSRLVTVRLQARAAPALEALWAIAAERWGSGLV